MSQNLTAFSQRIIELQAQFTDLWHSDENAKDSELDELLQLVLSQHRFNFDLWHEEDKAREPNANDSDIASVKRKIDKLNQARNDAITQIDELLENEYFVIDDTSADLPWNSETIGSIVDRLSIASLKVFHMTEQVHREDASEEHKANCEMKERQLIVQQNDLGQALQLFIDDVLAGKKQNKLYRQFKMYNDPNLNPKIYKEKS